MTYNEVSLHAYLLGACLNWIIIIEFEIIILSVIKFASNLCVYVFYSVFLFFSVPSQNECRYLRCPRPLHVGTEVKEVQVAGQPARVSYRDI